MFFSVLVSDGNLFSNFATFFLLSFMILVIRGFDLVALLIWLHSLDFLVLHSPIIFSTFLAVEFLCLISFLISLIWSEIVSKVNSNWSLTLLVAEEISRSICFFRSFSCFRRSSALIFNLWMLSFWAKLCCNALDTSSNSAWIFDTLRCIELIADVDFLCNFLAVLRDRIALLRIFDDLVFFCCNCTAFLEKDFIMNCELVKINL